MRLIGARVMVRVRVRARVMVINSCSNPLLGL
jgi:hypothetical protein